MDHDFQKFKEVCFQFLDFFDKKAEKTHSWKTFIFLIQNILFSNGGLHREKKD